MLSTRLGLLAYLLAPNHWTWPRLTVAERGRLEVGNRRHNQRTHADGQVWQGEALRGWLARMQPASVLEVGPGAGFFTRRIVEAPSVQRYVGVDLQPQALSLPARLSTRLITGTVAHVPRETFDAIVLGNVVHHVPDRVALFRALRTHARAHAALWAVDPTHSLWRLRKILRKAVTRGHLAREVAALQAGTFGTHNMVSRGEYRRVLEATGWQPTRWTWHDTGRLRLGHWTAQALIVEAVVLESRHRCSS